MEIIELLLKYVDIPSVLLALGFTQLIRWKLPTPEGGGKFDVSSKIYKVLPFFPIVLATIVVTLKDGIFTPTMSFDESIVRGILSGFASSWLYRSSKVWIFGKDNDNSGAVAQIMSKFLSNSKPDEKKPDDKPAEEVTK